MTTPIVWDNLVAPLLVGLLTCVKDELATTASGPPCRSMVVHGMLPPVMDGCDCACENDEPGNGDAWVRLVRLDPDSAAFAGLPQGCPPGWLAVIELGTYRCVPTPDNGEEHLPLPATEVSESAIRMLADMNALLRVLCCVALKDRTYSVEGWSPIGPTGGCGGGALQISVAIPGGPGGC